MTYCTKCGMANPNNAIFCTGCGVRLQTPTLNMAQSQQTPAPSTVNNFYYGRLRRRDRRRLIREGQGIPLSEIAEKEVVKEIVLVPCAFCGSLMPQASTICPHCGATRKR